MRGIELSRERDTSVSCSRILPPSLPRLQYSDPSTAALTTSRPHPTSTITARDNMPMLPDESRPASTMASDPQPEKEREREREREIEKLKIMFR